MSSPRPDAVGGHSWGGFWLVNTLVGARLRMVVNGALRAGAERRATTLISAVVGVGLGVLSYRLTAAALSGSDPAPGSLDAALTGVLGTLAAFTAVTSITFALSALYFARDLDLLLVSPLPARSLLLSKLLVQLGTGVCIAALLGGPPLAAYMARHGELLLLPPAALAITAMAAVPLCAGTAVTVLAVRVLPARRVRDAGGLLVTVVVFVVTAVNLVLRGPGGFTRAPAGLDAGRPGGIAGSPLLPTGWAVRAVEAATRGDVAGLAGWGAFLVLVAAAALAVTARVLERPFVVGFMHSLEAGRRAPGRRRAGSRRGGAQRARPDWWVLAVKDLRETLRDASQLGQLILPIALFAFYIAAPSSGGELQRQGRLPSWYSIALTACFASLFAASGVALRGVGSEGRRLWILRSSPVGVRSVLAAKLVVGAGIAGVLGEILLAVGVLRGRVEAAAILPAAVRVAVVVSGLAGLAVGLGAVRPRLDWSDPRRSVGVGLSIGFLAVGSTYVGACFVVLAIPYALGTPSPAGIALADAAVGALALGVSAGALAVGAARFRAIEL